MTSKVPGKKLQSIDT